MSILGYADIIPYNNAHFEARNVSVTTGPTGQAVIAFQTLGGLANAIVTSMSSSGGGSIAWTINPFSFTATGFTIACALSGTSQNNAAITFSFIAVRTGTT